MSESSPIEALARSFARAGLSAHEPLLIACSGGRDSQVLMHAVAALCRPVPPTVAHVHHGLQAVAEGWLDFCAAEAERLGLPFLYRRLSPPQQPGRLPLSGLEAWAREWRYRALAEMATQAGASVVLTGHHAHDQLETVEIRRRRGSGVLGLAGMRERAPLPFAPAGMLLLRPFLGLSRRVLEDWAKARQIGWVDDPANEDGRFTRNRVRQYLAVQLATGQQSLPAELQAIGLFQQAADQIQRQAAEDVLACSLQLRGCAMGDAPSSGMSAGLATVDDRLPILSRAALLRLPAARRAEALRHWLALAGCRMPSRLKLGELERQLVLAAASQAIIRHDGVGLLRYRDRIGRLPALKPVSPLLLHWQGEHCISLPSGCLHLDPVESPTPDSVPAAWLAEQALLLDQGRGRDRWRPHPLAPSRSWKNLMQERGVPPCLRSSLPVLRRAGDGALLFAAPFGVSVDVLSSVGAPASVDEPVRHGVGLHAPGSAGRGAGLDVGAEGVGAGPASAQPVAGLMASGEAGAFIRLRWVPAADIRAWV
ncbi:MAG: tRNA lysidine(34) synthetase TilS [Lautropia sp.]|nr:tRNA lysidine(34) synthetase TilS [Lautropia sp.]